MVQSLVAISEAFAFELLLGDVMLAVVVMIEFAVMEIRIVVAIMDVVLLLETTVAFMKALAVETLAMAEFAEALSAKAAMMSLSEFRSLHGGGRLHIKHGALGHCGSSGWCDRRGSAGRGSENRKGCGGESDQGLFHFQCSFNLTLRMIRA
ncbi:hypothetical protein [Erythrobacter rubeus]|uniref:Uncharacterized protein n=1 Tax=Erythrobacter rubeus TaxID=2760803 RepID=A0ABR8KTM5_9SPHN|nr:hypothetical protein [Erythrobacter rubeus]MBD2841486.1 hypothetical protein [Erythrobacter rubeus]